MAYYIRKTYFSENRYEDRKEGGRSRTLRVRYGAGDRQKESLQKRPERERIQEYNKQERKSSIRTVNDGWKEEDKVHKKKLRYE